MRLILSCGWLKFRWLDTSCSWLHPTADLSSGGWIRVVADSILRLTQVLTAGYELWLTPSHGWLEFQWLEISDGWVETCNQSTTSRSLTPMPPDASTLAFYREPVLPTRFLFLSISLIVAVSFWYQDGFQRKDVMRVILRSLLLASYQNV